MREGKILFHNSFLSRERKFVSDTIVVNFVFIFTRLQEVSLPTL